MLLDPWASPYLSVRRPTLRIYVPIGMFNHTGNLLLQATLLLVSNSPSHKEQHLAAQTHYKLMKGEEQGSVCYGSLGCYSTSFPWTDKSRPVSYFPIPPEELNVRFCLYTRQNVHNCQLLDYNTTQTIYSSSLIPSHRMYIISHGFLENGFKPWINIMKTRLLQKCDCNVIAVDWQFGSSPPYTQAVANIRLAGAITAELIATLHHIVGVKTEYVHIIGHSLGAHLAGYAGNILQTKYNLKLGRITGMDPAEPHFSQTDPIVRLDPTDATFVDIIHTDAAPFIEGGLGMDEPIGHLDFYPNGGDNQPGCDQGMEDYIKQEDGSIVKGVRKYLGCDHVRSYEYFIESIRGNCEFIAIECDTYENFLQGKCFTCQTEATDGYLCAHMGLRSVRAVQKLGATTGDINPSANRSMVKLFTLTNGAKPYCKALYRVTVIISNSSESQEHGGEVGQFSIRLDGIMGTTEEIPLYREQYYKPGARHTAVVGGKQVGRVRAAELSWRHIVSLNILTWRFHDPILHIDRVIIDNLEEASSIILCLNGRDSMISGRNEFLRPCNISPNPDFT